jgi:hypothetical protein
MSKPLRLAFLALSLAGMSANLAGLAYSAWAITRLLID